jgi:LasA protease
MIVKIQDKSRIPGISQLGLRFFQLILRSFLLISLLSSCIPSGPYPQMVPTAPSQNPTPEPSAATPLPGRPSYAPGELVDYVVQTGDTLPGLAGHFNTTIAEIRVANPIIPKDVTTLPPGMPMKIPIYFLSLWGSPFKILPDDLFVNGPAQVGFDTVGFVNSQPGWFKDFHDVAAGVDRTGGDPVLGFPSPASGTD